MSFEATVALLGGELSSDVKGGENSGRSLRHDFVALSSETKALSGSPARLSVTFELPPPASDARRLAIAGWVTLPGRAGVEQAAGGWLRVPAGNPR